MTEFTCLHSRREITLFYSLMPLFASNQAKRFWFTTDLEAAQRNPKRSSTLLIVAAFLEPLKHLGPEGVLRVFGGLRERYQRVVFWDDNAGSSLDYAFLLPFIDLYFKKHLLRDRGRYLRPMWGSKPYGMTVFSDFYLRRGDLPPGTAAEEPPQVTDPKLLEKLRPIWNLGWGTYPLIENRYREVVTTLSTALGSRLSLVARRLPFPRKPVPWTTKDLRLSARYSHGKYDPAIGYQRDHLSGILARAGYPVGRIGKAESLAELNRARMSLSPFGWGEVCFRDFESILSGAALIKPDCSHLETYPDIYRAGETYLPIAWDGSDLLESLERWDQDQPSLRALSARAFEVYRGSLATMESAVTQTVEMMATPSVDSLPTIPPRSTEHGERP